MLLSSALAVQTGGAALAEDPIQFAPPHSNYAVDNDGDSLYEYLVVEVGINVTEPGWYFVVGVIYTDDMEWDSTVWNSNYSSYDVGTNVTELSYSAFDIYSNGLNGTYYAALELYDHNSAKIATSNYTLGVYSLSDFDSTLPTTFEAPHSDCGLDTDGDGSYDYLAVFARLNVTLPGFYGIVGSIEGLTSNATGDSRNATYLELGIQYVEIRFNGDTFAAAQVDGPYNVSLDLLDFNFNRFLMADSFLTQDYVWTQFSSAGAHFNMPHYDASIDTNGDGAMEYLAVYVRISVVTAGYYNVTGTLSVAVTQEVDGDWSRPLFDVGDWNVTLLFSGEAVKATMFNGSFYVRLELFDGNGTWLWGNDHITLAYRWIDFARPPIAALVTVPVPDGTNLNLTLDATVSSIDTVAYEVRWDFDGDGIWDTDWTTNLTILHTFPGFGTYTVVLEVRDLRGFTNQSKVQVTVTPPSVVRPPDDGVVLFAVAGLVGVLLIGSAVLIYMWPVEVLVALALTLLVPLYSRLRKDEVLENYRRGMIHGLILAHPGICFTEIKEALSISSGSLVYHLGVLQSRGEILSRRSGALVRYYVNGTSISQIVKYGLTDLQADMVKVVTSRGQVTRKEIQDVLSISKQVVHYNIKKLIADNIITPSIIGGRRSYRLVLGVDKRLIDALNDKERTGSSPDVALGPVSDDA